MRAISCGLAAVLSAPVLAQSDVDATHKWCWGENAGFFNWRDAGDPDGDQGVENRGTFLSGYAWGENTGWITLGDGSPANGVSYGNTDGADCGVNVDPGAGDLSGYAWGENIGWVNFAGGALADPAFTCPADFNGDGDIDTRDVLAFLNAWAAGDPSADFDGNGLIDTRDVLAFLNAWTAGCA